MASLITWFRHVSEDIVQGSDNTLLATCLAHVIENALKKLLGQGPSSCPTSPMRCSQLHQIRARLTKPALQLNTSASFGTLFGSYWGKGLALVSVLPEMCPVRTSKPRIYRVSYTLLPPISEILDTSNAPEELVGQRHSPCFNASR